MSGIHAVAAAFYPTNSVIINVSNRTVSKVTVGGSATATYTIDNDGTVRNHNLTLLETWLAGVGGVAANYDVRATLTSGTTPTSGTLGAWLNCVSDRSWSNSNSAQDGSTVTSTILVEIRDAAAPNTVRDSASIIINATSEGSG